MSLNDKVLVAIGLIVIMVICAQIRSRLNFMEKNTQEHFLLIEKHLGIVK